MTPDVSIIMPAYRAERTICEAAASALNGQGVSVELVICSDDGIDYRSLLVAEGLPAEAIDQVYSPAPRSGPAAARNLAVEAARAPLLAALDADDSYTAGRLRAVLKAMEREGVGAGTGELREQTRDGEKLRIAHAEGSRLDLKTITTLRMPFSPVFDRTLAPGWPPVAFAEDMVLNAHLCCAAGGYAFAENAAYHYFIEAESVVQGPDSLHAALTGYREILDWLPTSWVHADAQSAIKAVIREDMTTAENALANKTPDWRSAFR